MIPLALTLIFLIFPAWQGFFGLPHDESFWGRLLRANWREGILLATLILAQVAAWRGWFWPLRILLHAAWIGLVPFTIGLFG